MFSATRLSVFVCLALGIAVQAAPAGSNTDFQNKVTQFADNDDVNGFEAYLKSISSADKSADSAPGVGARQLYDSGFSGGVITSDSPDLDGFSGADALDGSAGYGYDSLGDFDDGASTDASTDDSSNGFFSDTLGSLDAGGDGDFEGDDGDFDLRKRQGLIESILQDGEEIIEEVLNGYTSVIASIATATHTTTHKTTTTHKPTTTHKTTHTPTSTTKHTTKHTSTSTHTSTKHTPTSTKHTSTKHTSTHTTTKHTTTHTSTHTTKFATPTAFDNLGNEIQAEVSSILAEFGINAF